MAKKESSIKLNFVMNCILAISSFVFPLITYPYVSRILLPIGNGKVGFATSIISYFLMFSQLGIPTYGIRLCAKVRDNKQKLSKAVSDILSINIVFTIISYAALTVSIFVVPKLAEEKMLMFVSSASIILSTIGMEWLFKGLEEYSYITIRSIIVKIVSLVLMFVFVHKQGDYIIYAAISVFASSASFLFNFFRATKLVKLRLFKKVEWKVHLKPIFIFFIMSVAVSVYTNLDTTMLGFMVGDEAVGLYGVAIKIRLVLLTLIGSLSTVLLPRASHYYQNQQMNEFWEIMRKSTNFIFVVSLPALLFFIVFAKNSVLLLSGSEFVGAVPAMQIIMPTLFLVGLSGITGMQILVPMCKEKIVLCSEIAGAVVDFLLNLILIPSLGIEGAAIGTLVAEIAVLAVQCIYLRKYLVTIFSNISIFRYFFALMNGYLLARWVLDANMNDFAALAVSSTIFFIIYIFILIVMKEPFVLETIEQLKNKIQSTRNKSHKSHKKTEKQYE